MSRLLVVFRILPVLAVGAYDGSYAGSASFSEGTGKRCVSQERLTHLWPGGPFARTAVTLMVLISAPSLAFSSNPYDGVYEGTSTLIGAQIISYCSPGRVFRIKIIDGAVRWKGGGEAVVAPIAADGTFNTRSGLRFVSGRVVDGKLTATMTMLNCTYAWSLSR